MKRTVYIPDDVWHEARARVLSRGTTVSAVLTDALRAYLRDCPPLEPGPRLRASETRGMFNPPRPRKVSK